MTNLPEKQKKLAESLSALPSCLIAFSGGLDSVFLAFMAKAHVPGRVLCVTVSDPSTPRRDIESAKESAESHGLEHLVIQSEIQPEVLINTSERCYHCKSALFTRLDSIREKEGLAVILDGENASDSADDRPGSRAAREHGILSPLAVAGLAKSDIRELAREAGLKIWDRPASACLCSRVPFGTAIDTGTLGKIDRTEDFIRSNGIGMVRARAEGKGIRLELGRKENTEGNWAMLKALDSQIMKFGWESIEIDPNGYVPAGMRKKDDGK